MPGNPEPLPVLLKASNRPATTGKGGVPINKGEWELFLNTHVIPDGFLFSKSSASNWNLHQWFLKPVLDNRGDEIDSNHQLLGNLSQCRYAKDLYRASFEILANAGPFTVFYVGQREMFLSNAPGGKNTNPPSSTANPLILSGKRIRTQRSVPAGIITGDLLLERLSLSDEGDATGVVSAHTHKRNISDSSFLSILSDTSKPMGGKIIDESVGSAVFHAVCVPPESEIERHTTPANGYVVQYTMNPVSYYTETAFGDFRARSDDAAWLYNWNPSTGYSRVRCDDREPLFLIEAKASQAVLAEPQLFIPCLSFIACRIEGLEELGHTFNSMAGLPSWLWEAYIVCVDQMRWQLKSVTFPLGYLGEILGEKKITGGLTLKHFKVQFRHHGAYQTYLVPDHIEIIKIQNAHCKKRTAEIIQLEKLNRASAKSKK